MDISRLARVNLVTEIVTACDDLMMTCDVAENVRFPKYSEIFQQIFSKYFFDFLDCNRSIS